MSTIMTNAKVIEGRWQKTERGWVLDPAGKGPAYGIVCDEQPSGPCVELYRTADGAQKLLTWLRANSSGRGLLFRDMEG
jgi:hypothetical protein